MKQRNLYSGDRFRRALTAFLLGRAAQAIGNFVLILLVVRFLEGDDYGAYMALWGLVETLVPLSSLGLLEAVRRFMPELATKGSKRALVSFLRFTTLTRLSILSAWAVCLAMAWPPLATWIGLTDSQAEDSRIVVLLVFMVLAFRHTAELLETLLEQRWSQTAHATMAIGRLLGLLALAASQMVTIASLLLVDVAVSALCFLIAQRALIARVRTLAPDGTFKVATRQVVLFAWNMAGTNLLQACASPGTLRLLAARMLGLEAMGLYAFLQQLLNMVARYMPAQLLSNLVRPMLISQRARGDARMAGQSIGLMWKSNLLIVMVGVAVSVVAGDSIIKLASGERLTEAGFALLLLMIGLGANCQVALLNMAMQIFDHTRALRAQSFLLLSVPAAAWMGARLGLEGFVAGVVTMYWFRNAVSTWWMQQNGVLVDLDYLGVLRMVSAMLIVLWPVCAIEVYVGPLLGVLLLFSTLVLAGTVAKPFNNGDQRVLERVFAAKSRILSPFVYRA